MAIWQFMFGMGLGLVFSVGLALIMAKPRALRAPKTERTFHSTPNENCAICLLDMTNDNMAYLWCGHAFHDKCLKKLREYKDNKCPTCREKFD